MSLVLKNLYHTYQPNTPNESHALKNINLTINDGDFIGIIGHTGSGKSTLIQHLNGLLKPSKGQVLVDGVDINQTKGVHLKEIRLRVGIVFQYPEHQLFEETVAKDIAFGPKNLGLNEKEIVKRVKEAMQIVQLDYNTLKNISPFELSGGQKRRVAIAGVLAMKPKYLILDEPTAGLDPEERIKIRNYVSELSGKRIVILATHVVSDIECIASKILLLKQGKLMAEDTPHALIQSVADKIFEKLCDHNELKDLMIKYPKGNVSQAAEGLRYRIVQDECPEGFQRADGTPNLEDVYLYWFKK